MIKTIFYLVFFVLLSFKVNAYESNFDKVNLSTDFCWEKIREPKTVKIERIWKRITPKNVENPRNEGFMLGALITYVFYDDSMKITYDLETLEPLTIKNPLSATRYVETKLLNWKASCSLGVVSDNNTLKTETNIFNDIFNKPPSTVIDSFQVKLNNGNTVRYDDFKPSVSYGFITKEMYTMETHKEITKIINVFMRETKGKCPIIAYTAPLPRAVRSFVK